MDRREVLLGTKPRSHLLYSRMCERSTLPTVFLGLENKARSRPRTPHRCHAVTPSRAASTQRAATVGRRWPGGSTRERKFPGSHLAVAACRMHARCSPRVLAGGTGCVPLSLYLGMSGWRIGRGNFGSHPDCACEMNEMSKDTQLDHLGSPSRGDAH